MEEGAGAMFHVARAYRGANHSSLITHQRLSTQGGNFRIWTVCRVGATVTTHVTIDLERTPEIMSRRRHRSMHVSIDLERTPEIMWTRAESRSDSE